MTYFFLLSSSERFFFSVVLSCLCEGSQFLRADTKVLLLGKRLFATLRVTKGNRTQCRIRFLILSYKSVGFWIVYEFVNDKEYFYLASSGRGHFYWICFYRFQGQEVF